MEILPPDAGAGPWRRESVACFEDVGRVTGVVVEAMAGAGYSAKESCRVRLSLEEAIINAHKHAHGGDWGKLVAVRYHVGPRGVVAQVEDAGPGFDPAAVPDPLAPENIERPSGRGLLIMRTFLSGVCHNERGNMICLCKHRGDRPEGPDAPAV